MKPWWCFDCERMVNLDRHGRCEFCQSDAVDIAVPMRAKEPMLKTPTVAELERLYQK